MIDASEFHGFNAAYLVELEERYRHDPNAVGPAWRAFFDSRAPQARERRGPVPASHEIKAAVRLAGAIREYGHLAARIDPLGGPSPGHPALEMVSFGVTEEELRQLPAEIIAGPLAEKAANALEAIEALRAVYCATTGYDYEHIRIHEEHKWLRDAAEMGRFRPPRDPIDPVALLDRLTQVEAFEHFLQRHFPGKTRFSIEGLDLMVPVLDEVIAGAAEAGIGAVLLGMAHRGRLNVLAHVLQKPYAQILAEFKDPVRGRGPMGDDLGWTGDVKYHAGACRAIKGGRQLNLMVCLAPNPSHLEFVNPVVEGMARAAGTRSDEPGPPRFDPAVSLPLLIHGDAAFPAQGVVAETLNLLKLPGYATGGTIHIIANNQLGFTTVPRDARSTLYASDLAKGFKIPIVHVNADDPEACIEAARLAFAYRARFHKDFLIDLVGYRRHGHNEGDEPRFTEPLLYEAIDRQPPVRQMWARILVERGVIPGSIPDELVRARSADLQAALESLRPELDLVEPQPESPPPGAARRVKTNVPAARLEALNDALGKLPQGFTIHPKLERILKQRRAALERPDEASVDWGTAEALAFASIIEDGIPIRFTGQDALRGTFSQRHLTLHDIKTGREFTPLQALPLAKAAFEAYNSPLTECAAVGFEHGYNVQEPGRLVVWEAQYGDFINVAQVMIDEFVASARVKWGHSPSLAFLLPHGYEGHGPDHSSARLERFLQLSADTSLRIANPTTSAQYFHLLRRQALLLCIDPLPLVVMTPKSLLRNPLAFSAPGRLYEDCWRAVLDDAEARSRPGGVSRLVLVSGKVYADLMASPLRARSPSVALARLEQLCPFPVEDLRKLIGGYPSLEEVVWLQEEPENMGAWEFVRPRLERLLGGDVPLRFVARPASVSPAEGSQSMHAVNQSALVERAFALEPELRSKETVRARGT